jgi:hypothetical protein
LVFELDHVLIAVSDLDAPYPLPSIEGGRHPGWGTANRIVPLGDAYIELVTVVDEVEAAQSTFGRWVAGAPDGPLGWSVRTVDLDAVAARLDLTVTDGSRGALRWRLAGVEQAAAEPSLPFFIEWAPGSTLPGAAGKARSLELHLAGDADRLTAWLGGHRLPITVETGTPAVVGYEAS